MPVEAFTPDEVGKAVEGGALLNTDLNQINGEINELGQRNLPADVNEFWDHLLEAGLSYLDNNVDAKDVNVPPSETKRLMRLIYQQVSGDKDGAIPFEHRGAFQHIADNLYARINNDVMPHMGLIHSDEKSAAQQAAKEGRIDEYSQKEFIAGRSNLLVGEMKKDFDEAIGATAQEIKAVLNLDK